MFESNIVELLTNTQKIIDGVISGADIAVQKLTDDAYKEITKKCSQINLRNHVDNIQKVVKANEGEVSTRDEVVIYKEMGTGLVGSQHPHPNPSSEFAGWVYDVNSHGESGWWYPTDEADPNPYKWTGGDGVLRAWTKGLPSNHMFYDAFINIKNKAPETVKAEIRKNIGKMY